MKLEKLIVGNHYTLMFNVPAKIKITYIDADFKRAEYIVEDDKSSAIGLQSFLNRAECENHVSEIPGIDYNNLTMNKQRQLTAEENDYLIGKITGAIPINVIGDSITAVRTARNIIEAIVPFFASQQPVEGKREPDGWILHLWFWSKEREMEMIENINENRIEEIPIPVYFATPQSDRDKQEGETK